MVDYEKQSCGNDLEFSDELIANMSLVLIEYASDDFWKILKYGSRDALSNPSYTITLEDKYNMVKQYNYDSENKELTRIKRLKFNQDIQNYAHSEIRIFDGVWNIPSQNNYSIGIGFEIVSHNDIIILDNGKSTINVLRHEIYKIFNGARVGKNISRFTNVGTRGSIVSFNDNFQGYQFTMLGISG